MNNNVCDSLKKMIDVNTPIIYICDYDFVRVDNIISQSLSQKKIFEWNPATGTTNFYNKLPLGSGKEQSLESFLYDKYMDESSSEKYLVLKEIHDYLDDPVIKSLLLLMSQRRLYDLEYNITIIILSTTLKVPNEIEKYVSFLEVDYPDENEINTLIEEHIDVNFYDRSKFTQSDRDKLMPSLKGMTAFEIDRMLDMAMSSNGSLSAEDTEMILKQKKQMVKKSGLLELIDTPEKLSDIGGMNALKNYLERKAKIIKQLSEAYKFGVSIPKGIFIVGMPGCGKSLCAKASAALFEAPLLKLDMGSMMGKYVGESESNLRKAIRIAEAASPCVLWIDEIEKAFSGVKDGNSDILMRMFGYFLSWLQDKKSAVYVIATANNAENLPPELKRKGRFDEIFCVDLPNEKEREDIFKVHFQKRNRNVSFDISKLVKQTDGFNGADIESVVVEAIEECFLDKNKSFTENLLIEKAKETVSISRSCKKQIDTMKNLFKDSSFKNATNGLIIGNK